MVHIRRYAKTAQTIPLLLSEYCGPHFSTAVRYRSLCSQGTCYTGAEASIRDSDTQNAKKQALTALLYQDVVIEVFELGKMNKIHFDARQLFHLINVLLRFS